jgi:hypothetical protein
VVLDISIEGKGDLAEVAIDATPETPVMEVVGTFQNGELRRIPWSAELTSRSSTIRLALRTPGSPTHISISNLSFTLLIPNGISASSLGSLRGHAMRFGAVDAIVRSVEVVDGAVGFEFALMPGEFSPGLAVTGLQGPELEIPSARFEQEALRSATPAGDVLILRLLLPSLEGSPNLQTGPARLSVEGLMLQSLAPVELSLPATCGQGTEM